MSRFRVALAQLINDGGWAGDLPIPVDPAAIMDAEVEHGSWVAAQINVGGDGRLVLLPLDAVLNLVLAELLR